MFNFLKQSTASQSRIVGPFVDDTDFKTPETALTIANTDIKLMKNGGVSVNKNSGGATHRVNGDYSITFDATDSNTIGELRISVDMAGALVVVDKYQVLAADVYNALFGSTASALGFGSGGFVHLDPDGETAVDTLAYAGPDGPGVYYDDSSGNPNSVLRQDGVPSNPVNTESAVNTLAASLGVNRVYLLNNSTLTLTTAHNDWEFVGIGEVRSNVVALGSQSVDRSVFRHLTIEGVQAGTARLQLEDGAIQDPGAGVTTVNIFAVRSGLVDEMQFDTSADNVLDSCFSLVAGTSAPIVEATGAAGTMSIRHYSGGIEFKALSASHNVSYESDGQVIFNADCNVNATVALRGNMTVTDNTAGMNSLSDDARWDRRVNNLDHLLAVAVTDADVVDDSVFAMIASSNSPNADWTTFDNTTDALQALAGASAPSAAVIADAVWDEARAGHVTAGTYGEFTGDAAMRGTDGANTVVPLAAATDQAEHDATQTDIANLNDPTAAANAVAVWDALQASHVTAGSFGEIATEIASILVDTTAGGAGPWTTGAAGTGLSALSTGTAQAGAANSLTLAVGESATNNFYNNQRLVLTGGTGAGQSRPISDNPGYDGTTKIATVVPDWDVTPDGTTTYEIQAADVEMRLAPYGVVDETAFSATATEFESNITEATIDHYVRANKGRTVLFTSGAMKDQQVEIQAYSLVGGRGHFTTDTMTDTGPSGGDTFRIL